VTIDGVLAMFSVSKVNLAKIVAILNVLVSNQKFCIITIFVTGNIGQCFLHNL
jgi:hypothetical protein